MRSYLITGGTGSFGRAFARRLLDAGMSDRVCIYSRGEHAQAEMSEAFGHDERLRFLIGDVRDQQRLKRAMQGVDIVIHAAALKRIEVGQYNPLEMVKTNVDGAINVIEAAQDARCVERVVALSTDKAFQPCSPYGTSKALAESLFLAANNTTGQFGPRFSVTRYGNVWWSNGSVGPRWSQAVGAGKAITVTDLECTRFYMTMAEAVDLVLMAVKDETGRDLWIPELPAYDLSTLVEAFEPPAVKVTGLPAWEKMHESMSATSCSRDARRMSVGELKNAIAQAA